MRQILSDAIPAAAMLANSAAQFRGVVCPLGIDDCSQCKHGVGTAHRGAAEVRRLQRLAAIDDKTACNQAVRRSR